MSDFWNYTFNDSPEFVDTLDELPLWSASFGLLLLKHVELKSDLTVLDIGCGTGFPLFELAERLGSSCKCYGLDTWANANARAKRKIVSYGAAQVKIFEGSADSMPIHDERVDLIVSNLGVNNFSNPQQVFAECRRVLKTNGKLALTTNLDGHWAEFYKVFEETLQQLGRPEIITKLHEQQWHRGTVKTISSSFTTHGFTITRVVEDSFAMRFLNGTAFLNHHFIKAGWLSSWQNLIPQAEWSIIFPKLEENLNIFAEKHNGLSLTVPMAFIEGQKV